MKKIILTGDRPTGNLHIGHYIGSLKNRVELQNSGEYDSYIMIADAQALTDNFKTPDKIRENIFKVACDYLSVGIDPEKSNIFIQSQISELTELNFYFENLVTVARLQRNPTVKHEIQQKNFEKSIPVGFFCYPISQAADILGINADLVPCGVDQLPMIEQTREIAHDFNSIYGELFKLPEPFVPKDKYSARLPGTDGNEKMSKSIGNCIYLCDDEKTLHDKVFSMYTDPNHIRVEDKGQVEGNMVFLYLDVFGQDKEKIAEMKEHYTRGGLGDVACKKYLFEVLNGILKPIREKRAYYEAHPDIVWDILKKGTEKARQKYRRVYKEFKKKLRIDYFN